jgi:hypothetical protein
VAYKNASDSAQYNVAFTSGNSVHVFSQTTYPWSFDFKYTVKLDDPVLQVAHHRNFLFFGSEGGGFIAYNSDSGNRKRIEAFNCERGACKGTFMLQVYAQSARDQVVVLFASTLSMASAVLDLSQEPTSSNFVRNEGNTKYPRASMFKRGCFSVGDQGTSLFVVNSDRNLPDGESRFSQFDWMEHGSDSPTMERVADLADIDHHDLSAVPVAIVHQKPHACLVLKSGQFGWGLFAGYTDIKGKIRMAFATRN